MERILVAAARLACALERFQAAQLEMERARNEFSEASAEILELSRPR